MEHYTSGNIALGGNVNANAGTATLTSAGNITQSGGILNAVTLTGSSTNATTLGQANTLTNLAAFSANGLTLNDSAGGLNITGAVTGGTGAASLTTTGGVLALASNNVSGVGVTLNGTGVTSSGGTVNGGSGDILVNAATGAINLAGVLTTTSNSATAVKVHNASTVALSNVTAGATGTVVIGVADITGAVTQTGVINTGTLTGNTTNAVTLTNANVLTNLGAFTSTGLNVTDSTGGLTVGGAVNSGAGATTITTNGGGNVTLTSTINSGTTTQINAGGSINGAGLITTATADLNAASGIGNATAVNLAASTITADTTSGNLVLNNALGTAVTANSVTTGSGSVAYNQTGGGALTLAGPLTATTTASITNANANITNNSTITGSTGVTVNAGTGTITNASSITNGGGASTGAINLVADDMVLTGTITAGSGAVSLLASSATTTIGVGGGAGVLSLGQAELNTITTSGGLTVGRNSGAATDGTLTVATLTSPTGLTGGGFTLKNSGDVALTGALTYNATNATTNNLNITSTAANITGGGAELLNTTGGAGNIVLTSYDDIGSPANPIHIGTNVAGLVTNSNNSGDIYIHKTGALNIAGVTNLGGSASFISTGNVTQSGAIVTKDLIVKTLNNSGASIILSNAGNDVDTIDFRSRNAADTVKSTGQLTFFDADGFNVVQASGGGIDFSSNGPITLSTLTLGTPASLDIDAGAGDIVLTTSGDITVEGPGQLLGRNITLNLANNVVFKGGVPTNPNYVPTQNNDLLVQATGNITINADHFVIQGGETQGLSNTTLKNDSIIKAGGTLTVNTTQSNAMDPLSGDFEVLGGTVNFAPGATNSVAQANAFITANAINLNVDGDLRIWAGDVTHAGGGSNMNGSASAIIQATNGKGVTVRDDMHIKGGTVDAGGTNSNAFAVFDPITKLNVKVGKNLILEGGSGPGIVNASILNSGEIALDIGSTFAPLASTKVIGAKTYQEGLILIGGKGSGLFDFNDNPLTENAYPITWTLHKGAGFTIDTSGTGGDAFIQSLAPRSVDSSLYGYLLFSIDRESTGKTDRAASDQGNFSHEEATSCN
jgi:hypothetical protein